MKFELNFKIRSSFNYEKAKHYHTQIIKKKVCVSHNDLKNLLARDTVLVLTLLPCSPCEWEWEVLIGRC